MYNHDTHDFLLAARDEFMMGGDYAFITLNADLRELTKSSFIFSWQGTTITN